MLCSTSRLNCQLRRCQFSHSQPAAATDASGLGNLRLTVRSPRTQKSTYHHGCFA